MTATKWGEVTTDATSPSTIVNDSSFGTIAWQNPGNASASDSAYATITGVSGLQSSQYLKATNFGFNIPLTATIESIIIESQVKVSVNNHTNFISMANGFMQKSGVNAGDNISFGGTWLATEAYISSLTNSEPLWGTTWTATDINDSGFGYKFNCTVTGSTIGYVNHIRITVSYFDQSVTTPTSWTKS